MRRSLKLLVSILSHTPFLEFRPIPEIAHINPDAPIILFMGIFFTDNSSNQLLKAALVVERPDMRSRFVTNSKAEDLLIFASPI